MQRHSQATLRSELDRLEQCAILRGPFGNRKYAVRPSPHVSAAAALRDCVDHVDHHAPS